MNSLEIITFALYLTARSVAKEILKDRRITSSMITAEELLDYEADAILQILLGVALQKPREEIEEIYTNSRKFLDIVTEPL